VWCEYFVDRYHEAGGELLDVCKTSEFAIFPAWEQMKKNYHHESELCSFTPHEQLDVEFSPTTVSVHD
jgi:hypothetical protein